MDEKIGGLSLDEIRGAATDDLNGKAPQVNPAPVMQNDPEPQPGFAFQQTPQPAASAFCAECGTPMTGEFCRECGWSANAANNMPPVPPVAPASPSLVCGGCGAPMANGEMFCGNCGWSVNAGAAPVAPTPANGTICENCGAPMGGEMFCGNCGWKLGTTVQKEFCPECGSVVINGFCQVCQQNTNEDKGKGWLQRFKDFRDGI